MKLLVIGSGGREHALAWKLSQSPRVQKVYVAPGNGGTAAEPDAENVPLEAIPELVAFARKESIYLTVVGPEAPLAAGVVDAFREAGLRIFGPTQAAAQLANAAAELALPIFWRTDAFISARTARTLLVPHTIKKSSWWTMPSRLSGDLILRNADGIHRNTVWIIPTERCCPTARRAVRSTTCRWWSTVTLRRR